MGISQYVNKNQLANQKDIQSTFRQWLGALICAHQSRPDVCMLIAKIATDLPTACLTSGKAIQLEKLYRKTIRYLRNRPVGIHYVPPPVTSGIKTTDALSRYRIVCFTDAGFPTVHDGGSIESNFTVFGKAMYRDGVIRCHGFTLGRRCAKIHRAIRSSLSAECHASATAGDYALRYQILLVWLLTRRYRIRKLPHPAKFPKLNHFEKARLIRN